MDAVTYQYEIRLDMISIGERKTDTMPGLLRIDALHSGVDGQVRQLRKKSSLQGATMKRHHLQTPSPAVEDRNVEQIAALVQEIDPMDRLGPGSDGIKEPECMEGVQRVCTEADTGADRLKLRRVFVDPNIPADEAQAPGCRESCNSCADDHGAQFAFSRFPLDTVGLRDDLGRPGRGNGGHSVLVLHVHTHVHVVHRHAHHVMHLLWYFYGIWIARVFRDEALKTVAIRRRSLLTFPRGKVADSFRTM